MRLAAAFAVLTVATAPLACGGGGARELLPDLDQAAPGAISLIRSDGNVRLVFSSAVDNVGPGPLLVEGSRASQATENMTVRQLVRRIDGSTATYPVAGVIRFVRSETHRHWHLLAFERYELRRASDGALVGRDRKTGFCLGDRYDSDREATLPNEPSQPVWHEECGRGQPHLLAVRAGISPGYGDDYVPVLEGQHVDVTGIGAGRYLLVHRVNPDRTLRESDYGNNAASVLLALRQRGSDLTVTLVRTCPDSERCP